MAIKINQCSLGGYLTADAKITEGDKTRANFCVAINTWKDDVTLFMNCTAWGKLAENICPNLYKGNAVFVHGELAPNTWTAKDGTKHDGVQLNVRDITYLTSKDQAEHTADDDIPY